MNTSSCPLEGQIEHNIKELILLSERFNRLTANDMLVLTDHEELRAL